MRLNAKNNAETKLVEPVGETDTSIVVEDASVLPEVPYRLSIGDEIVEVTEVDGNALTVDRAVEDTVSSSYGAGTAVENRMTAGMYEKLVTINELPDVPEMPDIPEYPEITEGSYKKLTHVNGHDGQIYYIKIGKIVYLQGSIGWGEGMSATVGTLPPGYRPVDLGNVEGLFIDYSTYGDLNFIRIRVRPDGEVRAYFLHIDGSEFSGTMDIFLSFPARD